MSLEPTTLAEAGKAVRNSIVSGYVDAFKTWPSTFVVWLPAREGYPQGAPLLCRKFRRFGDIGEAMAQAVEWAGDILRAKATYGTDAQLWPAMGALIEEVEAYNETEISMDELTAAYFLRHFVLDTQPDRIEEKREEDGKEIVSVRYVESANPQGFSDMEAIAMIGAGLLLRSVYDQMDEGLTALNAGEAAKEVREQKKD